MTNESVHKAKKVHNSSAENWLLNTIVIFPREPILLVVFYVIV